MVEPTPQPNPAGLRQSARVIRYGRDQPLPERRLLRAGPLTAVLEQGDLRYVKVAGQEVVRRIYVAIRNRNWDTIPARFAAYEVEADGLAFAVGFTAVHQDGDVDFVWEGRIRGTSAGVVTCSMDGAAGRTFLKNRIGFCVHHPMELAGTPAEVERPDGRTEAGVFPELIDPRQPVPPFFDMAALSHRVAGELDARATLRFEGDLFELEDQRNWTDASYKTFSTPLRLPFPVEVRAGQRIAQVVTLSVAASAPLEPAGMDLGGEADAAVGAQDLRVVVGGDPIAALPHIGLGAASHRQELSTTEIERLRALRPAHLRVPLDLLGDRWAERLQRHAGEAAALGAALELEAVAGDDGEGLDELIPLLATVGAPIARLFVFPAAGRAATGETALSRARQLLDRARLSVPVGGGARANFTELNQNRSTLPFGLMDVVAYSINATVHAVDELSVVETLAAQAATLASARAIVGDRPLAVGPVSLRPRFNPYATGRLPEPSPDELPPEVDARQLSLFGAGWTVGSIRNLASAGAASLTYYETTGWRGVVERGENLTRRELFPSQPGQLFPLYHVLVDAAEFAGADLLPVSLGDPLSVEALALRNDSRLRVLVVSFLDEPSTVTVDLPRFTRARVRLLDETTAEQAAVDGDAFRRRTDREIDGGTGRIVLELRPFAVATVDAGLDP